MTNWRATTMSGSVYEMHDGWLMVKGTGSARSTSFRPRYIKSVPHDTSMYSTWEDLETLEPVEVPSVGNHIYASGTDEWRLSTVIKSVEVLDG